MSIMEPERGLEAKLDNERRKRSRASDKLSSSPLRGFLLVRIVGSLDHYTMQRLQ